MMPGGQVHAHLGYFGSEYDCRVCNPVCGSTIHSVGLDLGTRTKDGKVVLTATSVPCGDPTCPVLKHFPKYPFRVRMMRQKGFRLPPNTKRVDRTTDAGNPYRLEGCSCDQDEVVHGHTREESVRLYRSYAVARLKSEPGWLEPWRGKNVACFCKVDDACHGDVVLELANRRQSS